jgi:hypothetical protein
VGAQKKTKQNKQNKTTKAAHSLDALAILSKLVLSVNCLPVKNMLPSSHTVNANFLYIKVDGM